MKKLLAILTIFLLFSSCQEKESENTPDNSSVDDMVVYQSSDGAPGLLFSGKDAEFEYEGFGGFKKSESLGIYIPHTMKSMRMIDQKNGKEMGLEFNINLLPEKFFTVSNNQRSDTVYSISYKNNQVSILQYVESTGQRLDSIQMVYSESIGFSSPLRVNADDCNDMIVEESEFNPCNKSSIYKQYADDWRQSTKFLGLVAQVGKAVGFIVDFTVNKICGGGSSKRVESFVCQDLRYKDMTLDELCGTYMSCDPIFKDCYYLSSGETSCGVIISDFKVTRVGEYGAEDFLGCPYVLYLFSFNYKDPNHLVKSDLSNMIISATHNSGGAYYGERPWLNEDPIYRYPITVTPTTVTFPQIMHVGRWVDYLDYQVYFVNTLKYKMSNVSKVVRVNKECSTL